MDIPNMIIAIDGYSSTGKSTFAKLIAKRFDFTYIDSGAIYRAIGLYALENKLISENMQIDEQALAEALKSLDIHFETKDGTSLTFIAERCVESCIRTLEVAAIVSPIAEISVVREYVDKSLRAFSNKSRIVMDGRDIGTSVFPDAQLKIFMLASPAIRAKRRYEELLLKGISADYAEVLENIKQRDYIDSHRQISPLRPAEDAIILDNSYLTIDEQLQWVEWVLKNKFLHENKSGDR